ncbi:uncharacterized protein LOC134535238 isoform X2 [Bacillus rossius redtenbacheri]|uniref:uncharacterized protein LOC134535238 isoform X2 n=1 Tax=Bacillus rossius redtenbacheri TaxID=93214 RepID=UPI002FDEA6D6
MAGACRLVLALALCCVRRAAAHEDVRLRLGRVDSVAALLGVLAPSDGRLCDEELLQQLEGDTEASQEELSNLRAVCNATKAEFTRAFPVIGGRALMPAKSDRGGLDVLRWGQSQGSQHHRGGGPPQLQVHRWLTSPGTTLPTTNVTWRVQHQCHQTDPQAVHNELSIADRL